MKHLQGLAETINALEQIGVQLDTEKLRADIRKEAQPIIDTAKSLAPMGNGDIRNSIGFVSKNDARYKYTVLIAPRVEMENAYKAIWIEFGTSPRFTKKGAYRGEVQARPFMRPAFDMHKTKIAENINENIRKNIVELAKKYNIQTK
jgi:HK97 gp10 family phage protein